MNCDILIICTQVGLIGTLDVIAAVIAACIVTDEVSDGLDTGRWHHSIAKSIQPYSVSVTRRQRCHPQMLLREFPFGRSMRSTEMKDGTDVE